MLYICFGIAYVCAFPVHILLSRYGIDNWYSVVDIMSLTPSVVTYIHLYYFLLLPITYMLYTSCYFHVTLVLLPVTYMLLSATYMLLPHLNVSE